MDTFPVSALIRHNPASELSLERGCGNIRGVQKISEIVCWAGIGVLLLFFILVALVRGFGVSVALFRLFADSPLPWWVLAPAALALALGFAYLFRGALRVRSNRNH